MIPLTIGRSESKIIRRGATAVEFSVVSLVFLSMVLGIIEFSRYFMVAQVTKHAAREIARKASVKTDGSINTTSLEQFGHACMGETVKKSLSGGNPTIRIRRVDENGVDQGSWETAKDYGHLIQVTISGSYLPMFTAFFPGGKAFEILASVSIPSEGN